MVLPAVLSPDEQRTIPGTSFLPGRIGEAVDLGARLTSYIHTVSSAKKCTRRISSLIGEDSSETPIADDVEPGAAGIGVLDAVLATSVDRLADGV